MANARKGFFSFPFFSSRVKRDVLSRIDRDEIIRLFERRSPVREAEGSRGRRVEEARRGERKLDFRQG